MPKNVQTCVFNMHFRGLFKSSFAFVKESLL